MIVHGFYPLNDSHLDPNVRGESPEGFVIHRDITLGAMVAGVKAVTIKTPFGLGLGEVWGVIVLDNVGGTNQALAAFSAAGSGAGEVDITFHSTDATDITNYVVTVLIFGKIFPVNA